MNKYIILWEKKERLYLLLTFERLEVTYSNRKIDRKTNHLNIEIQSYYKTLSFKIIETRQYDIVLRVL